MESMIAHSASPHGIQNKIARLLWGFVWTVFYRPSPRPLHAWRRFLLRLFGAKVGAGAHPYPTARVWGPWNLEMAPGSCLGDRVDCYNVARITLGANVTISQYTYLCAASHDYEDPRMPLTVAPIVIGADVWVCACAFVGPGVTIGEGSVVGARSSVFSDVEAWAVVAGTPARFIKKRTIRGMSPATVNARAGFSAKPDVLASKETPTV